MTRPAEPTAAPVDLLVPDPGNARLLRDAFGRFATGITIITAPAGQGCAAMTANSFASVSIDPPLVLWSPARASSRYAAFAEAAHFAIHVLAADQADMAYGVARNRQALDPARLGANPEGVPVLDRCLARFDCVTHALHPAGDHAIILGRVLRAQIGSGDPLVFFRGRVTGLRSET